MNNRVFSFYRESDGLFTGRRITTNDMAALKRDTPEGCVALEGRYDRCRHRVDLATGEVIIDESLSADRDRERRRNAALQAIEELERRQHRPMRELAADPGNVEAAQRLAEIDEQIAQLRAQM
jgi:hypothetical protein